MIIASILLISVGIFFFFAGAVGVIRFPDFYSRLHPAGMIDTMGLMLSMSGLALYVLAHHGLTGPNILTAIKIILIVILVYITSPTATHAIVDAGIRGGLEPWTQKNSGGSDDHSH